VRPIKSLQSAVTIVGLIAALKSGVRALIPRRKKKKKDEEE
jgi:hypothetical protein